MYTLERNSRKSSLVRAKNSVHLLLLVMEYLDSVTSERCDDRQNCMQQLKKTLHCIKKREHSKSNILYHFIFST